ncbi:MAG: archease [Candidatus Nanoarchaeia archaeon]|nr:archease [Candidatus Nanoarchaeia archaeon]MDD5357686.1 archease [Candidatus Nanoarchaeia archaeon]MDD5588605.1 archease [Candidatus Nanoarchaeia archaeon]
MKRFKFLEHTADVKFQAFGNTIEEAFRNSALALKETICDEIEVKEKKKKIISIKQKDFESLLYSFLEEILYLLDAEDFLISKVSKIKIDNKFNLKATIMGDRASEYEFTNQVKAVTYNDMFVRMEKEPDPRNQKKKIESWRTQVVLDV